MTVVHVVLPNDIDDPATPSGGNSYDRRICDGLAAAGWSVREHAVRGNWPWPGMSERANLARLLDTLPDNAVVLLDGLVASAVPDVLVPQGGRLRLVVLVHMPFGDETIELRRAEQRVVSVTHAVVTTSMWSRQRVLDLYDLPAERVHAAPPGVDAKTPGTGSQSGSQLLCVAAVTPRKGHDLLVQALATIPDLPWTCVCVGAMTRDADFAEGIRLDTQVNGLAHRISFVGPETGSALDARYAAADLLVLPSRGETYGMVVTEALAYGVPVLGTAASGLPEALGRAPDGSLPGILVPPEDPSALAVALRRWLADSELRCELRRSARSRSAMLTGWAQTTALISDVLSGVATKVSVGR